MKSEQKPHSFADVLDGTVDPAVLAHLEAGHPIYYFDKSLDSVVEERPDGTILRVTLKPGGVIEYQDQPQCPSCGGWPAPTGPVSLQFWTASTESGSLWFHRTVARMRQVCRASQPVVKLWNFGENCSKEVFRMQLIRPFLGAGI